MVAKKRIRRGERRTRPPMRRAGLHTAEAAVHAFTVDLFGSERLSALTALRSGRADFGTVERRGP